MKTFTILLVFMLTVKTSAQTIKFNVDTLCVIPSNMDSVLAGLEFETTTSSLNRTPIVKVDTIKVYFLVTYKNARKKLRCIIGYKVIKLDYYGFAKEWSYLDHNRKPLSKNINVWITKPIEK